MRARRPSDDELSAVARRRLALIGRELDLLRGDPPPAVPAAHPGARPGAAAGHPEAAVRQTVEPVEPVEDPGDGAPGIEPTPPLPVPPVGRHRHGGSGGPLLRDLGERACTLVPATLRGRVALTSAHLALVAVAVALALVVTTWWVVRATGGPETPAPVSAAPVPGEQLVADPDPSPAPSTGDPATTAGAGTDPSAGEQDEGIVVVDIAGKVRRPGIATLPVGSRVVDALEAAGGVRRGVSTTSLNLARILVDGEQVLVGVPGAAAGPAGARPPGGIPGALVNLNTATLDELDALSGVGPVTAQAILDWRTEHGRFSTVEELLEVSGIGEKTLADLAPHVTV